MAVAENKDRPASRQTAVPDLSSLTDEELLRTRICDLRVKIPGSEL